ncbi:hypothetical protein QYE76_001896 [Lolium multiflorum]|uniref:Uncharacterized protein n=1 Tax=Lolium multiflorum TaxID=4521 RepID=A0AAD8RPM1_LOLMU|nr:hypothetical protein QYE76_001896 [Lolium multiflorum]
MASARSPRRQLAPTVGHEVALDGVHIRAGVLEISGERTVSALVQRIYAMDFINDNAGCFANGGVFPKNGRIIEFGSHRVYLGTVPVRQCLSLVLVAPDPPRWLCAGCAAGSVEVMMTGVAGAGKEAVGEGAGRAVSTRAAKPPLERDACAAGASSAPPETPLQAAMNILATPIAQNIDPAAAQAELEAQRQKMLESGKDIVRAQRELNLTVREYNAAHGFASVSAHAARMPENRLKARNLDQDLRKEIHAGKSTSASVSIVEKPKYSSPDKTIKAAKAAVELCESLSGDALAKQQERVRELLETIEQQNAEQLAKLNKAAASKSARSTKNAGSKSHGQASSPHPDRRREKEMNAQQMTVYDPVLAGKQQAGQHDAGRKSQGAERGYARGGYAGNNHAGRYETGQNYRAARAAYDEEEIDPPRYRQARATVPECYNEADSARPAAYRNPLGERLGERYLPERDARHRLDRVYLSEMIEEEGPPGPKCFGPRIMKEKPPVRNFMLPRDTKTYDGTTKPEDWLADYVTAGTVKDAQPPQDMPRQQQLPPPPPLTGANALPVQPNRQQYQQVNRVEQDDQPPPPAPLGRNVYEGPDMCCVVFVTEPTDRQSVHRRSMEVNAVMPAVPKYMLWSNQEITWSFKDHPKIMPNPGGYALVVDPIMKGPQARVKFSKVLIDNGSSINIMYKHTMRTLGITENMLQPTRTTFHGIVPGLSCAPIGKVRVDVAFGGRDNCRVENVEFEVVDLDSPYHALLGRPALAAFMATTHTAYLKMKMPAPRGPLTVVGNYKVSLETASAGSNLAESLVIAEEKKRMQTAVALAQSSQLSLAAMSENMGSPAFKPTNETKDIVLDPAYPERTVRIGVPRELAEHSLNVRKDAKPVRQPLRRFAEDRRKIIGEEVTKLLVAGFIVEVTHTEWLANPVMVEKKKDENLEAKAPKVWRMCIDYTNLNKACPRDPFPLPRIDQVIDSTAGCELLSFLDAYSGFHQIPLKKEDQIKTAFITPHGAYCYVTMPFGLRNAGATYQRCMQKCLFDQIGKNVQVYVDDIVIKTKVKNTLIDDIRQTFDNLRRFRMKLNPAKCTFGVPAGKLLGFLVSSRGIEVNPVKIRAIERMAVPRELKDVQKFTGSLASLSRFVSRLGEKALPLYALMKKSDTFVWTPQADAAFKELKTMLATAPILASPLEREPMLLYIAATNRVVSVVVVVEREEEGKTVQRPVYYLSEVLSLSKQNYPHFQKMTYGVYMAATKLKHYFEEHPMKVVSEAPISDIMCNKDASGRIAKWAIQISPYVPVYERRDAIKSQALADFLVDWAEMQYKPPDQRIEYWKMHFDGSKLKEGLGAGVVLTSPKGDHLRSQKKSVRTGSFAMEIQILWYSSVPEIGMQKMPTWPRTGFTYKRLPDSSKVVSFTMCHAQKMKPRMLCPSWAHLGKKFLPE